MLQTTQIEIEPKDCIFFIKSLGIQFTPQLFQRCLQKTSSVILARPTVTSVIETNNTEAK